MTSHLKTFVNKDLQREHIISQHNPTTDNQ